MSPSPDTSRGLRAVTEAQPALEVGVIEPGRRSVFQHPATRITGLVGSVAAVVAMLVPLWQTWFERSSREQQLRDQIAQLKDDAKECKAEVREKQARVDALLEKLLSRP